VLLQPKHITGQHKDKTKKARSLERAFLLI